MWFDLIEHAMDSRYVCGSELAFAIEQNADVVLPELFRKYLCRFLRGEVERPSSRRRDNNIEFTMIVRQIVKRDYQDACRQIKEQRKAQGGRKSKTDYPPYLQAAEQTKKKYRYYFRGNTPETVVNILSSWRRRSK
jgi:hypothetical protein